MKVKRIRNKDKADIKFKEKDGLVFVEVTMNKKLEDYIDYLLRNKKQIVC